MSFKEKSTEKLIEAIQTEKLTNTLFFLSVISIILDATTTIYARQLGLPEAMPEVRNLMDKIGIIPSLIFSVGINLFFITTLYVGIKKIIPDIVLSDTNRIRFATFVCLFLADVVLVVSLLWACLSSSSAALSNLAEIYVKIRILSAT